MDFYPRSPRGERLVFVSQALADILISIHAPREGSDHRRADCGQSAGHFYPRSPRGERPAPRPTMQKQVLFLSTLPARGATARAPAHHAKAGLISIHAPREGSDGRDVNQMCGDGLFLSTLPARGATAVHRQLQGAGRISIHAPREGSDLFELFLADQRAEFLSTLPARGATSTIFFIFPPNQTFLSTLPARGATSPASIRPVSQRNFYPRSPRGERPGARPRQYNSRQFLSTLPARGATTPGAGGYCGAEPISIHAPREGSDRWG